MKKTCFVSLLCAFVCFGCYYDKEELLNPEEGTCDTANVTYGSTVVSLLQNHGCVSCHSGGAPSGNISLEGYANVKVVAQNGKLLGAISHSPGYSPMPQGGNKMSACNINKIRAWIDAGSPDN